MGPPAQQGAPLPGGRREPGTPPVPPSRPQASVLRDKNTRLRARLCRHPCGRPSMTGAPGAHPLAPPSRSPHGHTASRLRMGRQAAGHAGILVFTGLHAGTVRPQASPLWTEILRPLGCADGRPACTSTRPHTAARRLQRSGPCGSESQGQAVSASSGRRERPGDPAGPGTSHPSAVTWGPQLWAVTRDRTNTR